MEGPWNATAFFVSSRYWGRRPVLLKQAFATSPSSSHGLPSWEDILTVACDNDDDVPTTRLISHQPGTLDTFQVELGPYESMQELSSKLQTTTHYTNKKKRVSTLVVNDVDRYFPSVSDWMEDAFSLLPSWRRDDAQVSLANKGGGIGPHVDNYDVFLIQASGKRLWEVGVDDRVSVQDEFQHLIAESQVRILNMTLPTVTCELEEGDCLYLPPRTLHWGTATSDHCMTLSVGCRSPSATDLLSRMAEEMSTSTLESAVMRYTEETNRIPTFDQNLSKSVKDSMKKMVLTLVHDIVDDEDRWDELVGKLVTEPVRPIIDYPVPLAEMEEDWKQELGMWANAESAVQAVLDGDGVLRRAEGISFAWSQLADQSYKLYVMGRAYTIPAGNNDSKESTVRRMLDQLANGSPLDRNSLEGVVDLSTTGGSLMGLLKTLLNEGLLYGEEVVGPDD